MRWVFIFLFFLSCGGPTAPKVTEIHSRFLPLADQYAKDHYGVTLHMKYFVGDEDAVYWYCRQENIWGCDYWDQIVALPNADECQIIFHEMMHSAAYRIYGDWDYDHEHMNYNDVPKICEK